MPDSSEWNNTVLGADGKDISFVDAHYYPLSFSGSTGGANRPTSRSSRHCGTLGTWSYSAQKQNSTNSAIVTETTTAGAIAHGITLPAESITVLQTR